MDAFFICGPVLSTRFKVYEVWLRERRTADMQNRL
jgi:hypothetical protein